MDIQCGCSFLERLHDGRDQHRSARLRHERRRPLLRPQLHLPGRHRARNPRRHRRSRGWKCETGTHFSVFRTKRIHFECLARVDPINETGFCLGWTNIPLSYCIVETSLGILLRTDLVIEEFVFKLHLYQLRRSLTLTIEMQKFVSDELLWLVFVINVKW